MSEYHRMMDLSPRLLAMVEEAKAIVGDLVETAIADHLIALGWKRPDGDTLGGDVTKFLSYPPRIRSEMLDLGKAMVELEAKQLKSSCQPVGDEERSRPTMPGK